MTTDLQPLSTILREIQRQHGVTLYAQNLSKKNRISPDGARESTLDLLSREGLARSVEHGSRRIWEVERAAIPRLIDLAGGRPGPEPVTQITLDAAQARAFARTWGASPDPAEAVRESLQAATGWDDASIGRLEKVIVPVTPRRPR